MRKAAILAAFVLAAAIATAGCDNTSPSEPSASPSADGVQSPAQSPSPSDTVISVPSYTPVEVSDNDAVDMNITFPSFSGIDDDAVQTAVNGHLFSTALQYYEDTYKETAQYYRCAGDVSFLSADVASVVFRIECETSSLPYTVYELQGCTFDLQTGELLPIGAFMSLDDVRAAIRAGTATSDADTGGRTLDEWADMISEQTAFYLTEDCLVVAPAVEPQDGGYAEWFIVRAMG